MVDSTKLPEIDINAIATDLNNKVDRDLTNSTVPYVVSRTNYMPTTDSQETGYGIVEIWSDGYCVQTGRIKNASTIVFKQPYRDNNYIITAAQIRTGSTTPQYFNSYKFVNATTTTVDFLTGQNETPVISFRIEGYIR